MPLSRKGRKDDAGNYRPVSTPSGPGAPEEVLERIMLSAMAQHVQDTPGISSSEQECMKVGSCLLP